MRVCLTTSQQLQCLCLLLRTWNKYRRQDNANVGTLTITRTIRSQLTQDVSSLKGRRMERACHLQQSSSSDRNLLLELCNHMQQQYLGYKGIASSSACPCPRNTRCHPGSRIFPNEDAGDETKQGENEDSTPWE